MNLTIVICTHNRANLLRKTLESLNQTNRPSGCEVGILVIANVCTDNTIEMLESYKSSAIKKNLVTITLGRGTHSR